MGRRNRERKLAIQKGNMLSIREQHDGLMFQVIRRARQKVFDHFYEDDPNPYERIDIPDKEKDALFQQLRESIEEAAIESVISSLVPSLQQLGRVQFHEKELREDGWDALRTTSVMGILAGARGATSRTKDGWKIRTRVGRLRTGTWIFCQWCGEAKYTTPSAPRKYHSRDCYLKAMKWRRLSQSICGSNSAPRVDNQP